MLVGRNNMRGPTGATGSTGSAGSTGATGPAGPATVTTDVVVNDATKGLVLKDTQATPHFWRASVSTLGVLVTADIGTDPP